MPAILEDAIQRWKQAAFLWEIGGWGEDECFPWGQAALKDILFVFNTRAAEAFKKGKT